MPAIDESTDDSDLLLANQTLRQMGFHGGSLAWIGKIKCYLVTLQDEIHLPPDRYKSTFAS